MKIYMGDMLYANDGVGNRMCPLPVGFVASYVKKHLKQAVDIKLFKRPDVLLDAIQSKPPDILALSNYSWTKNLSIEIMRVAKKNNPNLLTVLGGPNYPRETERQVHFFSANEPVDFHLHMEGEQSFLALVERAILCEGKLEWVKSDLIPGVHFFDSVNGEVIGGPSFDRIVNLDDIPSPYLEGWMDQFLETNLQPMIQTNRGCPFTCTFCVEGQRYHTKVRRFSLDRVTAELEYIAERVRPEWSLSITDSNFGMYEQDIETCKVIRRLQDTHNWPFDVVVSSGKNRVDRVTECAKLTRGAVGVSLQVQSMDTVVLKNIRRQNISLDGLVEAVNNTKELTKETRAFSAVIIPLPGETLESHIDGLRKLVNMEMDYVCPFQLIMLEDTESGTDSSREQYGIVTKWRPVPNYHGQFGDVKAIELEEIAVANNTFSFDNYLEARGLHFLMQAFHSDGAMLEVRKYLQSFNISPFDWIRQCQLEIDKSPEVVKNLYNDFIQATQDELWDSEQSARDFFNAADQISSFTEGELGDNILFKFRAIGMTSMYTDLVLFGVDVAIKMIISACPQEDQDSVESEMSDIAKYVLVKRRLPVDRDEIAGIQKEKFDHDLMTWENEGFKQRLRNLRSSKPILISFYFDEIKQNKLLHAYETLGSSVQGKSQVVRKHNPLFFVRETARAGYYGIETPVRAFS